MKEDILDSNFEPENNSTFEELKYAGFWIRVFAAFIDLLVISPILILVYYNMIYLKILGIEILASLIITLYKPFFEYKYGATIGKMALKIKVVNEYFEKLSLKDVIIRNIIWIVPSLIGLYQSALIFNDHEFQAINTLIDYGAIADGYESQLETLLNVFAFICIVFVGFTEEKQGLHDMMANTYSVLE